MAVRPADVDAGCYASRYQLGDLCRRVPVNAQRFREVVAGADWDDRELTTRP